MKLGGLQAVTLLDFPEKVACTVFTQGCNFRCHYCHNPELVLPSSFHMAHKLNEDDFFKFLKKRKNLLQGVCITGGEPTLHKDLYDFIKKIKKQGLAVKLDTNGTNPEMLKKLLKEDLLDYVAMDIKQTFTKYKDVVNVDIDTDQIKKSVDLLKNSDIDYEFRTTVMAPLLQAEDIYEIADYLEGAKAYNLQYARTGMNLVDSDYNEIKNKMTKKELEEVHDKIKNKFTNSVLR